MLGRYFLPRTSRYLEILDSKRDYVAKEAVEILTAGHVEVAGLLVEWKEGQVHGAAAD